jgi:hypothetical protein
VNRAEFETEMARLIEQWKGSYSEARQELIAQAVKHMPADWWKRTVDQLLGECRQAPLLPEIRGLIALERERNKVVAIWDGKPISSCEFCVGNGVYLCTHKTEPGFWAFRCHCEAGNRDPRKQVPQFKQDHAKEYVYFDARVLT